MTGFFPPPKPPEFEHDIDAALHWVKEREATRIRKERGGPPPFSKDPIIATWKFTCVRREDDFTTRWIDQHIRKPFADHPLLWFMLCIARTLNYAPTLETLISPDFMDGRCWPNHRKFSPEQLRAGIEELWRSGKKYKSAAYKVVSSAIDDEGWPKWLALGALAPLLDHAGRFEKHFARRPTLQGTHELIYEHKHWGGEGLLAYQVVVDLRFTPVLCDAKDIKRWCSTGKGTRQGLNRVHGRDVEAMPPRGQLMHECIELWPVILGETGVKCDLSDVPNIFCEADKYIRTLRNEGHPKERYEPRHHPRRI